LTFGGLTATSTATPDCIDLGATFNSTSASTNLKIKLYVDSSGNTYGFTANGSGELEYYAGFAASPGKHVFLTGGSERARIDSSGRLLVGTSSSYIVATGNPGKVQSIGETPFSGSLYSNDIFGPVFAFGKSRGTSPGSFTIVNNGDGLGEIRFSGADGVGLATTVSASITAFVDGTPGANDMPGRLVFSTTADGASSPTERMRIKENGDILCGATSAVSSATTGFQVRISDNTFRNSVGTTSNVNQAIFFNPNGIVGSITTNGSATSYNTSSDYRLKENVIPVPDGITRFKQLKPSRFNFIADPDHTVDGFLAHEAQAVVPECVTGEKDAVDDDGNPVYQGIDQSKLVPLLTAALQEAIAKIEALETRLSALEGN
jgi:hypothetical protein